MKKSNKRGSIFTLLLGNYILFTFILAAILTTLLIFYVLRTVGIIENIDTTQIMNYGRMLEEKRFQEFPSERLLGAKGFILVLDQQQNIVYHSTHEYELPTFSADDIACIPQYSTTPEITVRNLTNAQGQRQIAVTVQENQSDTVAFREYILDENKRLIYKSDNLPMDTLTEVQYKLLTNNFSPEYSLLKHQFQADDGASYTMLLFGDRNVMLTAVGRAWSSFFILLGLAYGTMVFFFILWLNRRIKKPLHLLCQELNSFESGKSHQATYQGPREFVEIFDSFNDMSQRLQRSEEERQHLERAKQKMLADISHDLKTPITVIQGYAKALCDGVAPPDEQTQYLQIIEQKATGLNELINTFYQYSKMEHPDYSLTLAPYDICNYLRDFVADRYAGLELAGFLLEVDIPEQHIFCNIDTVQLGRAFDNIVNNSVKHNPKGTTLYFSLQPRRNCVRILLADNGIGIPDEIQQMIFEPFVVGEESRCSHGSGLGLSIAKKIVEAHHGTIQLLKPYSHYSTVYKILLPTK